MLCNNMKLNWFNYTWTIHVIYNNNSIYRIIHKNLIIHYNTIGLHAPHNIMHVAL